MRVEAAPRARANLAQRQIEAFFKRFGEAHLSLAYHAAFPLALTPDLLYRLWANFQRDSQGAVLNIPWIAVSDVLLHLCDEVGHELYEMDRAVRQELLHQLQDQPRFGLDRLRELADFVLIQVEPQLRSLDPDLQEFARTQQWGALAYKQPEVAAREIALLLTQLSFNDKTEWVRLSGLLDSLSDPLADYSTLQVYAQAMADFVRGRTAAAVAKIQGVIDANHQIQAAGVDLPIPTEILAALPLLAAPAQPEPVWLTWLKRYRWLIGGGGLALVLVAVVAYLDQTDRLPRLRPNLGDNPPSESPADLPSPSPSPTQPSPTLSPSPSPSPSLSPSPSPSILVTPPATPIPTPSATPSDTPSPNPSAAPAPAPTTNGTGTTLTPGANNPNQTPAPSTTPAEDTPKPGASENASPTPESLLSLRDLQQQQEEIAAELAVLRGRVDALEQTVSNYEGGQIPPTRAPDYRDRAIREAQAELTSIRENFSRLEQQLEVNIQSLRNWPTSSSVQQEDVSTLQRLDQEFAAELAALRGRQDALDSRLTALSSRSPNSPSPSPSPSPSSQARLTQAEVIEVVGTVEITSSNGSSRPAQAGDVLVTGDELRTGTNSSARLRFNEGSIARIAADTTFRMTRGLRQFQLPNSGSSGKGGV